MEVDCGEDERYGSNGYITRWVYHTQDKFARDANEHSLKSARIGLG